MNKNNIYPNFRNLLRKRPDAWAVLHGNELYPDIIGAVSFYDTYYGVLIVAELNGLPKGDNYCQSPIFAFHIHEGNSCSGNATDRFANVRSHYDPHNCPHPYHAGDMPPLFGASGKAFSAFLTDRFKVNEIIGKTIVIHASADDFTTQPAGNAGSKIACGEIIGN